MPQLQACFVAYLLELAMCHQEVCMDLFDGIGQGLTLCPTNLDTLQSPKLQKHKWKQQWFLVSNKCSKIVPALSCTHTTYCAQETL